MLAIKPPKNPSGLVLAIQMLSAGYPIFNIFSAWIITKLTRHDDLATALEDNYQSLADIFLLLKANKAQLREVSIQERRAMRKLDKYYRKAVKMVKQAMPREKWPEFGIDDQK